MVAWVSPSTFASHICTEMRTCSAWAHLRYWLTAGESRDTRRSRFDEITSGKCILGTPRSRTNSTSNSIYSFEIRYCGWRWVGLRLKWPCPKVRVFCTHYIILSANTIWSSIFGDYWRNKNSNLRTKPRQNFFLLNAGNILPPDVLEKVELHRATPYSILNYLILLNHNIGSLQRRFPSFEYAMLHQ